MSANHAAPSEHLQSTVQIVSAYLSRNEFALGDIPALLNSVHRTVAGLSSEGAPPVAAEPLKPAVPVKKSVYPDHIVCLDCGGEHQILKRHLRTAHELTPAEYRARWGLPKGYPLTAPDYAQRRSELAKEAGLGHFR